MISFCCSDALQLKTEIIQSQHCRAAVHTVLMPLAAVGDALLGVASAFLTLLPKTFLTQLMPAFPSSSDNYRQFSQQMGFLKNIIPIHHILQWINPDVPLEGHKILSQARFPERFLREHIRQFVASDNPVALYVARVSYLALAVVLVAQRAFLFVVGLVAAPMAIAHGAKNPVYNQMAIMGLSTPLVVRDLLDCVLKYLDPRLN